MYQIVLYFVLEDDNSSNSFCCLLYFNGKLYKLEINRYLKEAQAEIIADIMYSLYF